MRCSILFSVPSALFALVSLLWLCCIMILVNSVAILAQLGHHDQFMRVFELYYLPLGREASEVIFRVHWSNYA